MGGSALAMSDAPGHPGLSASAKRPLTVAQVVPALDGGGVERGTLEVAAALARCGHRSIVISEGGRLVEPLLEQGSEHVRWALGRKSPLTLRHIWPLRRWLKRQRVDILHARSRMPAWIGYLAWRGMDPASRPRFITTMHGLHSVNAYSAIMVRGEAVIAVSKTVREHILQHYPATDPQRIHLIPRGVDPEAFPRGYQAGPDWWRQWHATYPQLRGARVLTLPGRITRLKGHDDFIELIARLREQGREVNGLIVGGEDPHRRRYARDLRRAAAARAGDRIIFTGHRSDIREVYAASDIILSLSKRPESFGRTVLEALSMGVPVIGYDHGGVGELLEAMLPEGRVTLGDREALTARAAAMLDQRPQVRPNKCFLLSSMLEQTLAIYEQMAQPRSRD